MKKNEALPRADEFDFPVIKQFRKMVTYLVIGRAKDSDENPWIEFETDSKDAAEKKCFELNSSSGKNAFKVETRTLFNDQIDNFNKSKKTSDWIENVNININSENGD